MQIIDTLLHLGWRGATHRAAYEVVNRSGMRSVLEPGGEAAAARRLANERILSPTDWMRERPPFFLRSALDAGQRLSSDGDAALLERARHAVEGTVWAFGAAPTSYGNPICWHRDPASGDVWRVAHWSRCPLRPGKVEVKRVWEIARFPQTYLFLRAFARTGDRRWADAFFAQSVQWLETNPYRCGVHWANGQEIAIRLIAWLCGMHGFDQVATDHEHAFCRVQASIALQCDHVARHIGYARFGMRNNHLLAEALALYVVGSTMPWLRRAGAWRSEGLRLLAEGTRDQFTASGEYVQNSHTYHRLAMVYLAIAVLTARQLGDALPREVEDALAASAALLAGHMNAHDGRLPNWGENDGADVLPLTGSDYTDFRPALALAHSALGEPHDTATSAVAGDVDAWLHVPVGPAVIAAPAPPRSLHVLRRTPGTYATLRSAPWRGDFGHADLNHTDIWLDGVNIAGDTGSYLYSVDRDIHQWLSSTPAHNTIAIADASQRRRVRSWRWSGLTTGRCAATASTIDSECTSFVDQEAGPLVHRRVVEAVDHGFLVRDEARLRAAGPLVLQWLLTDADWRVEHDEAVARYALSAMVGGQRVEMDVEIEGVSPDRVTVTLVRAGADHRRGWCSRHYAVLSPATSVAFEVLSTTLHARTRFTSSG